MSSHTTSTKMYSPSSGKKRNLKSVPRSREADMANLQETLKVTKEDLAKEKKLREDLDEKYSELQVKHEAVSKANEKHTRTLERFRNDNEKKSKQIELMQREQTYCEQRIKNLELRVSEVEKTEMQLETLREVLKNNQSTIRDRDNEIKSLKQTLDDVNKQLHSAKENIQDLNTKVGDLNQQVRDEVKRNQAMEKELEVVPILEKELDETKESLEMSKKHLLERRAQLSLARQTIKEQRNKIQSLEAEVSTIPQLEKELQMAHYEILTLKKLIIGKDSLVVQKTQELECMKEQIVGEIPWSKLYSATFPSGAHVKVSNLETRAPTPPHNESGNTISSPVVQHEGGASDSKHSALHRETHSNPKPWQKLSSKHEGSHHPYGNGHGAGDRQQTDGTAGKGDSPDKPHHGSHSTPTSPKRRRARTAIVRPQIVNSGKDLQSSSDGRITQQTRPHSSLGFHPAQQQHPSSPKRRPPRFRYFDLPPGSLVNEEDWLRAQFVQFGDRVMVKPEEKGKAKKQDADVEKPPLSGIVKFVGKIDRGHADHTLYVGVRMDEPIGDTDGVFYGKRYFNVMPRHGKLYKISEIVSVLHPKSQSYKLMKECLREERLESGKTKSNYDTQTLVRV